MQISTSPPARSSDSEYQTSKYASSSGSISLLAHPDEAGAEPHHELGPGAVRLLLRGVDGGVVWTRAFKAFTCEGRGLHGSRVVVASDETVPFLGHGEIGLGALAARGVAGGRSTVAALDLTCLLLVALLQCLDLLPGGLLLLCLLLLLELAAGFLDGLAAGAAVDLAAAAHAESFVYGCADCRCGGHGVGGGSEIGGEDVVVQTGV